MNLLLEQRNGKVEIMISKSSDYFARSVQQLQTMLQLNVSLDYIHFFFEL